MDTRRTIKLEVTLYDKLKESASNNHRTLAGEIAWLLESTRYTTVQKPTTKQNGRTKPSKSIV